MNSFERKELKRSQARGNKWKQKAIIRNKQLRLEKLANRDLARSRQRWQEKYFDIQRLSQSSQSLPVPQVERQIDSKQLHLIMISICINLTVNCSVSFRSVPKILTLIADLFQQLAIPFQIKIPHFTTVINWTLRVGKYLLDRPSSPLLRPWICIVDHTIQVGTKKAFVVLKVPHENLKPHGALTLKEVEVLYLKVQETCNGVIVSELLQDLFQKVGYPSQIVMDGGPDLNKGVRLLIEMAGKPLKVTYDVTHLIASLLKKKYQHHSLFNQLLADLSKTRNALQQTALAYLLPITGRAKARFLNLPSIAEWTKKILSLLDTIEPYRHQESEQQKIIHTFEWLLEFKDFLQDFWVEIQMLTQLQKLLKTTTLNDLSYKKALTLIAQIPDRTLQAPLLDYLKTEFEFAKNTPHPILLTSDIIESLFGKYKYIAKPHAMSELNRMVLLLPTICEPITPELIEEAFNRTPHQQVTEWLHNEIGDTLLSKRKALLTKETQEKHQKAQLIPFPKPYQIVNEDDGHGQKTAEQAQALG